MIKSRKDLSLFLAEDKMALGRKRRIPSIHDYIWKYERLLRYEEYIVNCRSHLMLYRPIFGIVSFIRNNIGIKVGFEIPVNTFDMGLNIAHNGPIIVNSAARIGRNCRIHPGVTIGTAAGYADKAPTIGNNCYIGPGAKIFGSISIGDNVLIGANAVVNKSFGSNIKLGGVPAKILNGESNEN